MDNDEASKFAVEQIRNLCLELKIPNLKSWGIEQDKFESAISKMAVDALNSGSPGNNPRVPSQQEIEELYRTCYDYQFSGIEVY